MPENIKPNIAVLGAIKERLLEREPQRLTKTNYFLQQSIFAKDEGLPIPRQKVKAKQSTIMAFADDAPNLNWAHPCRYLLHDAETGELYKEIPAQFPPYAGERDTPESFRVFHEPVVFARKNPYRLQTQYNFKPLASGKRYAILFSGMSNNRHTNDLEFLYRTLRDVYQVPQANIVVLNQNGTINYDGNPQPVGAWPGDNTPYRMTVNGAGSKTALLGALDGMKNKLKANDTLIIHTNNHGGHNGIESDLCCFPNWDSLGVKDFTNKLAELPKYSCLMVMMEQCHSGGFNQSIINKSTAVNTSVASACTEFNNSIGGWDFDPFARDWIAAMAGIDPYGHTLHHDADTDGSGHVSAKEAFDYADSIHDPYDTPVFNFSGTGNKCRVGNDLFYTLPPYLLKKFIKRVWPEPNPVLIRKGLELVLPEIERLNAEFEPQTLDLQQKYEERAAEILSRAKVIK